MALINSIEFYLSIFKSFNDIQEKNYRVKLHQSFWGQETEQGFSTSFTLQSKNTLRTLCADLCNAELYLIREKKNIMEEYFCTYFPANDSCKQTTTP